MEEAFEKLHLVVDAGQTPTRIDKFLATHLPDISRNRVQNAIDAGQVVVGEQVVRASYKVQPNDLIRILTDYEPVDYTITPEDIPLNIVFEDDDVMVVNKPAGMVVHPGHGNFEHTLLHAVAYHWKDQDLNDPAIGLVHRIDKDTSGLLLLAKTPHAKTVLAQQFFEHSVERTYQALVWGRMDTQNGTIHAPLMRSPKDRTSYTVCEDQDLLERGIAKDAITHWDVLEPLLYTTLIACHLETGRTHQIRVHLASIGHPLFNDERYGGHQILKGLRTQEYTRFIEHCFVVCPRQALHAKTLGFTHPETGERMFFDSTLPDDMQNLLNCWREYVTS